MKLETISSTKSQSKILLNKLLTLLALFIFIFIFEFEFAE